MAEQQQDLTAVADELIAAFNAADWARFAARLDPEVAYEETGTGRRTRGVAAYVALCQGWKVAFPDGHGAIRWVVADGDTVVQELTWTGTQTGPLAGPGGALPASGRRIEVPASFWLRFRDGRVAEIHHHLDLLTMLGQVGALPASAEAGG